MRKPLEDLTLEEMERMGAMVETNYGIFHFRFFPRQAPTTVKNFIKLVQMGFYDGLPFPKVVPGYLIQGGDPKGDGSGGPGWTVPLELNSRPHVRGAVGMFHPPFYPNDGGSQFYIMVTDDRNLDKSYAVFGEVEKGMETVDRIASLPLQTKGGQPGVPRNMALMLKVRIELIPAPAAR